MKTQIFQKRFLGVLTAALMMCTGTSVLMAAGTASGTLISNAATVDYKVATVDQPTITSATYVFKVDNKVNLTVSTIDVATVKVTPGTDDNVLTYLVTNTGNTVQDFALTAAALAGGTGAFGGTDNIDANTTSIVVESGATAGFQVLEDTATYIDELAADANKTVYMLGDFDTGFSDGDIAAYYLVAEAHKGSTPAALGAVETETASDNADPLIVDVVLADGDGDGVLANDDSRDAKHSSLNDYEIATADLTITKSSAVISDPFNNTTNPKRIPGAVVEYTITIDNAGTGSTATDIIVTDNLNTEIATNGTIAFNTQYDATAGKGIVVTAPNLYGGAATELTNAADADEGAWNAGTNVLTVTGITVAAGETATVKFRVTIQ